MRLAAKSDGPQSEIIAALRKAGCYVKVIREPVDLLVGIPTGRGHRWQPMEVKAKGWRRARAGQARQAEFIARYHVPVVKTAEDALIAAGLMIPGIERSPPIPVVYSGPLPPIGRTNELG